MKRGNIVFAIFCMILSIVVIVITAGYPKAAAYGTGVPGPGLWPMIVAIILFAVSAKLLFKSFKNQIANTEVVFLSPGTKRVYISMLILILYVAILETVGFLLSSLILLFGFIQWFAKLKLWQTATISIVTTLIIYCVFRFLLNVPVDFGIIAL